LKIPSTGYPKSFRPPATLSQRNAQGTFGVFDGSRCSIASRRSHMMFKPLTAFILVAVSAAPTYAQSPSAGAPSQYGSPQQPQGNQPTSGTEAVPTADPGVTNRVTGSEACKTMPGTSAQRPKIPGSQAEPQPQARCDEKK
jgi:hypothetical protein